MIKIGFLGNMNNAAFSCARYLGDKGFDCEVLIYEDEPEHFSPAMDCYVAPDNVATQRVAWGDPANFLQLPIADIKNTINRFDIVIGNGLAPAIMEKLGRRLDIFTPYGYDLYSLPFYKLVHPLRVIPYFKAAALQIKGIRRTPHLMFDKTNPAFENLINKVRYPGNRVAAALPMLYSSEYNEATILQHQHAHPCWALLKKTRAENEIIFLQHIRQLWKTYVDKWSAKGNDILLRAYKEYLKRNPQLKTKLILFEYGIDVDASKNLIRELGISDHVIWLPLLPRKYVMITIFLADLVIGELQHSWLTYGSLSEALCLGKPVMHKRNDDEFSADYESLYPMIYADSEETVLMGLEDFAHNKPAYQRMGDEGRQWFNEYLVNKPLNELCNIITTEFSNKN